MAEWQPIETAPKDGTKIWAWLYDTGIVMMHWMSAEENCAEDGGDNPGDYISCWVLSRDPRDDYAPSYWCPLESIQPPPGVTWVSDGNSGRWRDLGKEAA